MMPGDRRIDAGLVTALSELAARVQRGRTSEDVLRIAGEGVARLGMRFIVFQIDGRDLVLRYVATAPDRRAAVERMIGQQLVGLRAPTERCGPAVEVLGQQRSLYRSDLDLFVRFVEAATGRDPLPLDHTPATSGISNGIVTPVFVREEPWGLLSMVSPSFRAEDAAAVSLFATHVGSALEVAEFVQALQKTQEELVFRERLAAIGELAAVVAHEVRNPLGVLFNSVASLRRLVRKDVGHTTRVDAESILSIVSEETERLNAMATDLLEYARPTAIRAAATSLPALVHDLMRAAREAPEATRAEVRVELAPALPAVHVDARLVRQALLNLVLNALQAMPGGGTLTLRVRMDRRDGASFACIDVSDTGPGIAVEHRDRVLEPFFTTKAKGTGLGLSLVQRVVDAHRGELTLESSASGTTFTIRLPAGGPGGAGLISRETLRDESQVSFRRGAGAARPWQAAGTG